MRKDRLWWIVALLFVSLASCHSAEEAETTPDAADDAGPASPSVDTPTPEDEKRLSELSPDDLKPSFWGKGPKSVVSPELVVDFPRPITVADRESIGAGTDVRIEPEIEGSWRLGTRKQIVFRPSESFEPGTSYTVVVESVDVRRRRPSSERAVASDVIRPDEPWTHTFEMPDFAFIELLTPVGNPDGDRVEVDMRFSAPPSVADLSKWASWTVNGTTHEDVSYSRRDRRNVIRATLHDTDIDGSAAAKATVGLELAAGVPYTEGRTAPAANSEQPVSFGEKVDIREVHLREGHNGFYLHVICHDEAVSRSDNFYNVIDYHDYRDISERCVPHIGSAKRHISIEPEVDVQISPAAAGFQIRADFERGTYEVELKPGLQTVDGGVVQELTTETFEVGARSPTATFVGSGRYIPPGAWENLAIRHRNVDAVRVDVRHVPRENLVFWLSGRDHDANARTSNLVGSSKVGVGGERDETKTSYIDLSTIVDERKQGVHEVVVHGLQKADEDEKKEYRKVHSDTARLVLTDLNLIAKRHEKKPDAAWSREVMVWAIDMHTGEPRNGVNVEAVRPSGYKLGKCKTGTDGHCRLELAPKETDPTGPFALVASSIDDTTFLEYEDLKTEVPTGEIGGEPYLTDKPYQIGLYGDRDLYRPAETVHVAGVLRSAKLTGVQRGIPVELELINARGDVVRRRVTSANRAGAFEFDYELGDLAPTGRWRLRASVGEKKVGTHSFFVEEFVPERMDVDIEPSRPHIEAGQTASLSVRAEYLFGASAEGSTVKATCSMAAQPFAPEGRGSYHFGAAPFERAAEDSGATQIGSVETSIGDDGTAAVECANTALSNRRSAKLRTEVSVLEAGSGRSTDEATEIWVHPDEHVVGLRSDVEEVEENTPFTVEGIVTDWSGETVDSVEQVEVAMISLERDYSRYHHRGHGYDWRQHWRETITGTRSVQVRNGTFQFEVNPTSLRDAFALRVRAGKASSTLQLDADTWSYHWRYSDRDQTPQPSTPTSVPIDVSGPVEVGSKEEVTFEAPFEGRALVAVETHRVLEYAWREVEPGENTWNFQIDEFVPNAYVTVFLVKDPHLESEDAFVPERAFGVQSVDVRPTRHRGELELSTPSKVRPSSQFDVEVEAEVGEGPAWVTVAAVDQGILQLTDYESPNPLDQILADRALGVDTFDTVGWNVRMPSRASASGGGAARPGKRGASAGRVMPVDPVAMWSGLVRLENGRATIPFRLPNYRGELRIMGVAIGKKRVAAANTTMKVRDPLGLQVTSPRFLSSGDEVSIPVFVTNQTGSAETVRLSISSKPIPMAGVRVLGDRNERLRFEGDTAETIEIEDGASESVVFRAKAVAPSGAARIRVDARSAGDESHTTAKIPIQPSTPSERRVQSVKIDSKRTDLSPYLSGWVPTSERTTFRVTRVPFAEALDSVRYLIDYPYGCIEQTTSSTRPLIYMSDVVESVDPDLDERYDDIDEMVDAGIDRVLSMQTPDGGFGYWPGDHEASSWSSAYATEMLMDARDEGYDVPKRRLQEALEWLADAVRSSDHDYAHAYMHYVLARAGRGDKAAIRSEIEQLREPDGHLSASDAEKLYLAKAALYLAGDRRHEESLRNLGDARLTDQSGDRHAGGDFYSSLRHYGWALSIHLNLFGRNPETETLIVQLAERMKSARHLNTQEAMWGVTALGTWLEEGTSNGETKLENAELYVGGERVEPSHTSEDGLPSWSVAHAADRGDVELRTDISGSGNWYVMVGSEGVRKNPSIQYGDKGLTVTRKYLDAEGNLINPYGIEVGDLFYVQLALENESRNEIENVAIVDRLPAGLEVENPRLSGSPEILSTLADDDSYGNHRGRQPQWWYDHMNVRDDRVQVFGDLGGYETRYVVYGVRATLGGSFTKPPIEAHAMYVPTTWSRHRGGEIRISTPESNDGSKQ